MAGDAKLAVTLSIVDRATAPLKAFSSMVKSTVKPFRDIRNGFKFSASELGIPVISKSLGKIKGAASGVVKEIKSLAKEVMVVGGIVGGVVAGMTVSTANAGDAAFKAAQKVGLSTESWSKLAYAADMSGVSSQALQQGLNKLNSQAIKAARGGKEAQYWFRQFGISVRDQNGKLKSSDAMMMEAAEKLAGMEDGAKKTGLAVGLFGESLGPQLIPFLNAGKEGIAELMAEAERLGLVFTDDQGKAAESFNDSLARVKKAISGVTFAIGNQLIPVFEPVLNKIEQFIVANRELVAGKVAEWLAEIQNPMSPLRQRLDELWDRAKRLAKSAEELVERFGGWSKVLPVVGAALVGIKLAPLISSVLVLTKAIAGLGVALLTTPIGWIALAVGGLAAGFVYLWRNCEGFRNFWVAMWDRVKNYVTDAVQDIRAAFDKGIIEGIKTVFAKFNPLRLIVTAMTAVVEYFAGLDIGFGRIWDGAKKTLADFKPLAFLVPAMESVEAFIAEYSLGDAAEKVIHTVSAGFKSAWKTVGEWGVTSRAWVKGLFAGTDISDTGTTIIASLRSGFKSAWDTVGEWGVTSRAWIKNLFSGTDISGNGLAIITSFQNGIESAWTKIGEWGKSARAWVSDTFSGIDLFGIGESVFSSLWKGFKSIWTKIEEWFNGLAEKIGSLVPESLQSVIDSVSGIAGGLASTAGSIASSVGNTVKSVGSTVGGWMGLGEKRLGPAALTPENANSSDIEPQAQEARVIVEFKNMPKNASVRSTGPVTVAQNSFGDPFYNGMMGITP